MQYHLARDNLWSFTSDVAAAEWPVSSPLGLPTDTLNPTDLIHRRILDERVKADDRFCLVLDCGEWSDNLATTWIVELVSTRVQ